MTNLSFLIYYSNLEIRLNAKVYKINVVENLSAQSSFKILI